MTKTTRSTFSAAAAVAALLVAVPFAATIAAQQAATAVAQRGRPSATTPSELGLHGYSVVLVVGDMQPAAAADSVPSAARKALTDMQAFLPYKRYQLLDAAWMVCCGSSRSALSGRVRGPENGEYAYSIETLNGTDDSKLTVRFSMRDTTGGTWVPASGRGSSGSSGGRGSARGSSSASSNTDAEIRENIRIASEAVRAEHSRQLYEATKERDEAELALRLAKEKVGDRHPDVLKAAARYNLAQRRVDELQHPAQGGGVDGGGGRVSAGRSIMDSTFSIALGETVVIGTSRLKGDQALIVLLTAATKPGAGR